MNECPKIDTSSRARKTEHMRSRQMCHAGPRWCPNRGIAWHTEWLLIHVRYMNSKRSPSLNSKGHFRVPLSLCIKTRLRAQPYDMEMIFHPHANKTHFHKKGWALGLILKVGVFGTRKSLTGISLKCSSAFLPLCVVKVAEHSFACGQR